MMTTLSSPDGDPSGTGSGQAGGATAARVPGPASLGKLRRLQRISDPDGFVRVAAIDHPENYLALFDADLTMVSDSEVVESKLELVAAMSAEATAVLVDPVWSLGQGILSAAIPPQVGIISGLEQLAYSSTGFGTETALRPHWDVGTLARLGVDMAKLVVFHRAERTEVSRSQLELVDDLVAECARLQVPLVVEPLWYPLDGETLDDPAVRSARVEAIIGSAGAFAARGADMMKVEFPGYLDTEAERAAAEAACLRLDAAVGVPWVLLSASATFEQFRGQLTTAARSGACGFMAGRAIWGDAVGRLDEKRRAEGARSATARLRELRAVLAENGRGWQHPWAVPDTVTALPRGWFEQA